MKYCFAAILPLLLLLSVFSCKPDDELLTRDGSARLEFSTDSVFFDTVFVSTGSVTRRLMVYNRNDRAVEIDEIKLEKLGASDYDLIINGSVGDMANKLMLRGNDSLLVLIKVFIDPNNSTKPFIVEDNLLFRTNGNNQKVYLAAYGQNANFFRDQEVTCNSIWEGPKAYVLYGDVVVPENCTLTIRPGTRIYSHAGAGLYILGTLKVEGTASQRVFFQNDRIDSTFNIPGQWLGIFIFREKSVNNHIQYAEVKNALFGFNINNRNNNETLIENTVIRNIFSAGILNVASDIKVVNTLITNCGSYAVAGVGGGNSVINYCTIANYTPDFKRDTEALTFTDSLLENNTWKIKQTRLTMTNSIVWNGTRSGRNEEIRFLSGGPVASSFTNCLLQTTRYASNPKLNCCNNILNQDPKFTQPGDGSVPARKINYSLKKGSPALGAAISNGVSIDLTGASRPQGSPNPDMGAYESPE